MVGTKRLEGLWVGGGGGGEGVGKPPKSAPCPPPPLCPSNACAGGVSMNYIWMVCGGASSAVGMTMH